MTEYRINVYKIWYDDEPNEFYIGSTKNPLSTRMATHRNACRRGKQSKIYIYMREKGINSFKYVLITSCMVTCMDEQRQFEQHWIDQLKPSLNMVRSFNTHEDTQQQKKQYYENNKEKYKQQKKRICVCGGSYRDIPYDSSIHFNSTKHTSFVLDFYERLNNIMSENN